MIERKKKTNNINSALLLGVFCLVLGACNKDDHSADKDISFPLVVKATAMEEQGPVKLYTKDGEVVDQEVIAKFIAHPPESVTLSFNEEFKASESDFIGFTTDSTASFGYSAVLYHVKKNEDDEIAFSTDFVLDPESTKPYHEFLDAYYIGKFNSPLTSFPAGSGLGYKGTLLSVVQGNYRSFRLPILLYYIKRTSKGPDGELTAVSAGFNKLFNTFNTDFISHLGPLDTIAVQQRYVRYKE
ncbi:hypothetical protein GCM10023231_24420 [Olivibacter ginsenosidimutans]|uniref:Lipoprotein n=1 Tax=Olivibacter ginsenosidimutans TaxID=1176537 RepID=A0ABP9BJK7_9SPHI